ncbi:TetR family transcriptional regulator [Chryseobacterium formosense]|uniref:TetR family transcriptional regulator n=1 Tax=Chryseobacterium formosense TaxID=236814 RepID=A0A085Z7L3_9FLAO|nr:TetR/AcrR family transcriptional regulator [Chryseobacterium formosense]KFF00427.1 TetR family transcriptional regulator [Chryseobacterium formosense]SFT33799.1 transcriptional regulator, TetR family [Chryseobacterium formosense]
MRGRPNIHQNEELIQKAQDIFWKKGYTATSLNDLLKITGAGSGSFYNTFKGGKKEVFKAAINQRRKDFENFKEELKNSENPIELIKDFFRSVANSDKTRHLQGCIIANTVVEMTFVDEELEKEAIQILKEVEEMYSEAIKKAQDAGKIKNQADASVLARNLITFWCGLNTLRRIYPDQKILSQQIELQLAVLS